MAGAMKARVLVIEDEPRLLKLVRSVLESEGYSVATATAGEEAIEAAERAQPDLVLLDILLPGSLDGYEVCRRIRTFSHVPIIMLTAKAQEVDKLRGFALGADDYVTKPFSSRELLARVRALLWRDSVHGVAEAAEVVTCGGLSVDLGRRRVARDGREIALTATEYNLLAELAQNAGKVMMHAELLARVWGPEYRDETEYLRTYIRYLRRKIEEDPSHPRFILSRPGIGYYLSNE